MFCTLAQQVIRVRKIFESFDKNFDGILDEFEFREFMESHNIQFNDRQLLALFAFFDVTRDGAIDWEEFSKHAMLPNPRGGTSLVPKPITATLESGYWKPVESCSFEHTKN